ncbi:MAG: sigma-70 family RNA polymerase sigma factor [Saprospiraceae bacterium]|nr:sigma-70 family RNA polymerase sigma factor [Saprospiraceae bacterium]
MSDRLEYIIQQCRSQNPEGQKALYEDYKDVMYSICLRYLKSSHDAEDILIEGFYKILTKIDDFKGEGSFEGWMKRIMVNESLMFLRKKNNLRLTVELNQTDIVEESTSEDEIIYEELLTALNDLPVGYRTVFNLYVIEGYKHREIAELLNISINTSKSQLILAKKRLQEIFKKKEFWTNNIKGI